MKTLITKRSIMIAAVALLLAITSIISVNVFRTPGPVTGFANTVTMPVRALATTVARTFESIFAAIYRYNDLEQRYEVLAARYAQLVRDQHEAVELAEEVEILRELLGFRDRHAGFEFEEAAFVNWGSDNWSHSFVINRGYANSGISSGMGVATEGGILIGQVTDVGPTTSTVITILDTTFAAAAFVGAVGVELSDDTPAIAATATGDFNFMRNGLLILDYIDADVNLVTGISVITSGRGVFPPGLIIGEIEGIFPHASGIGQFATVRPMRDVETVHTFFVITGFEAVEAE